MMGLKTPNPLLVSAVLATSLHMVLLWKSPALLGQGQDSIAFTAAVQTIDDTTPKSPAVIPPVPKPPEPEKPLPPEPPVPPEPPKAPELLPPEPPVPPEPEPEQPKAPEPEPLPQAPNPPAEELPPPGQKKPILEVGRDGEPQRSTIAWIPYDDFQKLMAEQSITIQPALQSQADPVADAPIEMDTSTLLANAAPVLLPSRTQREQRDAPETTANTSPEVPAPPQAATTPAPEPKPQPVEVQPPLATALQTPANSQPTESTPPDEKVHEAQPTAPAVAELPVPDQTSPDSLLNEVTERVKEVAITSPPMDDAAPAIILPEGDGPAQPDPSNPDLKQVADSATPPKPDSDNEDQASETLPGEQLAMVVPIKPSELDRDDITPPLPSSQPEPEPVSDASVSKPAQTVPDSKQPATDTAIAVPTPAAQQASDSNEDRPTSVPRSDRESIATQDQPMKDNVVLGQVLVSDGLEIKTVRPRFNISTLYTAAPRNPVANIVFDKSGQVVRAELTLSSGYIDIDAPILNSLYRWRASGKKLTEHKSDTLTLYDMKLLLVEEPQHPAAKPESTDPADNSTPPSTP